jgi:hypothetical protein
MMVELALESNSTEPKGVWQDFLDLSWQRPILARRREVQRSLRTDVGCDGAERSNQMGATRGPKRALEGPPLHGDDWTAGLLEATGDFAMSASRRSATFNRLRRMSAAADLHRVTIIQRTSAIRTRSSKAAGLSPAILGHRCELLIGFI